MKIKNQEYTFRHRDKLFHCPMDLTMDYLGGRWKTVVLWYLIKETKRFSELKRLIPTITEKMLSLQLKQLEKDGLVHRELHAAVPPRVEYSLTDDGRTLVPLLKAMSNWGLKKARLAEEGTLADPDADGA